MSRIKNRPYQTSDEAVSYLNAVQGYTNRYRILLNLTGQVALFKAVGDSDLNVTGWLEYSEMAGFLVGFIDGYETAVRRMERESNG